MNDDTRSVDKIASDIARIWKKPFYGAVPYLRAMTSLETGTDVYGTEAGSDIIARFLANAGAFRGEKARVLKAELAEHLPEPHRTRARKQYAPKPEGKKTTNR